MTITETREVLPPQALPELLVDELPQQDNEYNWHFSDIAEIWRTDSRPYMSRLLGQVAGFGACAAVTGLAGVRYLPAHTMVGPHEAEVSLRSTPYLDGDLGPLGVIHVPTESIGANIVLKKIPGEPANSKQLLDEDLSQLVERYVQLFTDMDKGQAQIERALLEHFRACALVGGTALMGAFYLSRGVLRKFAGPEQWQLLVDKLDPTLDHGRLLLVLSLLPSTLAIGSTPEKSYTPPGTEISNPLLVDRVPNGTIIEGQLLNLLVDKVGPMAADYWEANEQFYDEATANLEKAIDIAEPFPDEPDTELFMFVTDWHCNIGQAQVLGKILEKYGVRMVVTAGDDTMAGTPYEEGCISTFRFHMGEQTIILTAGGNHDSDETENQERKYNYFVLDGDVIEAGGLTFLGDDDPMRSEYLHSIHLERNETEAQMGERLDQKAREYKQQTSQQVNVFVVHEGEAGELALENGDSGILLSGHTHEEALGKIENTRGETVVHYTGDDAAGTVKDAVTVVGPLKDDSGVALFQYNTKTGKVLRYRPVDTHQDASVTIGPITDFPTSKQSVIVGRPRRTPS